MRTVCEKNKCTGCMACVDICLNEAIRISDNLRTYNAIIDEDKCINCGACHRICQNNNTLAWLKPISWHQGWACEENIRSNSSSGGLATALSQAFIKSGGVVCSCAFQNGKFLFKTARNEDDINDFVGSKYVKSNPVGIYKKIRTYLEDGFKVLFIGLPCQIAAVKNYIADKYKKNLYTVDLICHGSPSPKNLEMFLSQYGYDLKKVTSIGFRKKGEFRLEQNEKTFIRHGVYDRYTLSYLNCINYTENCYDCSYARRERISDITIGDSWGSELDENEKAKGISLAICQTQKGEELLKQSEVRLFAVNERRAIEHNHQLERPSPKPDAYEIFFYYIAKGYSYNKAVEKALPRTCFNQKIKSILIDMKFFEGGG